MKKDVYDDDVDYVDSYCLGGGFTRGKNYKFSPPIETDCIVGGKKKFERGEFDYGWCLGLDDRFGENIFVFQGVKLIDGKKINCYFLVKVGPGVQAEEC